MRHWILAAILVFVSSPVRADAPKAESFGLGLMVGTMGAINAKYFILDQGAVDLGVEFLDHAGKVIYADFFWHIQKLFGKGTKFGRESSLYFGGGLGVGLWVRTDTCGRWNCSWDANSTGAGNGFFGRLVVGTEWNPARTRFGVFGEVGPSFTLYPSGGKAFDVAVGGRYYF